jgi:6-phosphogluconate dehydrogenase
MIVVVMGVAGSGKSTIGPLLADALKCPFIDGDDLHSPAAIDKMARGIPLTDADRAPWLAALHGRISDAHASNQGLVVACSALSRTHRAILAGTVPVNWVHLQGSASLLRSRLERRTGHFMKPDMLASQLEALEPPADAVVADISRSPETIVEQVVDELTRRHRREAQSPGGQMQIGLIGLGRMGTGMARRLIAGQHTVVGFDMSAARVEELVKTGASGAQSLQAVVAQLPAPRAVWVMVPHGTPTTDTVGALLPMLSRDDVIVDGGNSRYTDSIAHAGRCAERGVHFLDVGVSGGVWGESKGFNLMIGGAPEAFRRMEPIFTALAGPGGYAHVGPSGAGHFVKMMHNAIEYAMLQALGEGFECLKRSEFNLDLQQIAGLWQNGSVVRSWLLELLERALTAEGNALERIGDYIDDSGTGRWAVEYALDQGIPVPAISTALYERFDSRTDTRFAHQVIAALRKQFGGHAIQEAQATDPRG